MPSGTTYPTFRNVEKLHSRPGASQTGRRGKRSLRHTSSRSYSTFRSVERLHSRPAASQTGRRGKRSLRHTSSRSFTWECLLKTTHLSNSPTVNTQVTDNLKKTQKLRKDCLLEHLDCIRLLARNGIALRNEDEDNLRQQLQHYTRHITSCNLLGPSIKDIRQNLGFSNHLSFSGCVRISKTPSPNVRVRIFQFLHIFIFAH